MRRFLLLLLAVCLLSGAALSESYWMPGLDPARLEARPIRLTVRPAVSVILPLDESRTDDLNALLKHLTLVVTVDQAGAEESWEELRLLTDEQETLRLLNHRTAEGSTLSLSSQPEHTWFSSGDTLALLTGAETPQEELYGITPAHLNLFEEADALLEGLLTGFEEDLVRTKGNENVKGYGKTTQRIRLTVEAKDAAVFGAKMAALCPEGVLSDLAEGLTFSGKQSLSMLASEDGQVLKLTYSGRCGIGEDIRKVNVTWRRQRSGANVKDEISLTSPAVKGNQRDTLTLKRTGSTEGEVRNLSLSLSWEQRRTGEKVKNLSASLSTSATPSGSQWLLSGNAKAELKTGSDVSEGTEAGWSLAVSGEEPSASGTVTLKNSADGHTVSGLTLEVSLERPPEADWEQAVPDMTLDGMDGEALRVLREETLLCAARDIVRALVLLPEEDTLYLSRALPDWQTIVDAARRSTGAAEEVN